MHGLDHAAHMRLVRGHFRGYWRRWRLVENADEREQERFHRRELRELEAFRGRLRAWMAQPQHAPVARPVTARPRPRQAHARRTTSRAETSSGDSDDGPAPLGRLVWPALLELVRGVDGAGCWLPYLRWRGESC